MIVMCAWHKRNFGHAKIIRIVDDGNNIVSDGMCPDCQKIWLAEEEKREQEEMKKGTNNDEIIDSKKGQWSYCRMG